MAKGRFSNFRINHATAQRVRGMLTTGKSREQIGRMLNLREEQIDSLVGKAPMTKFVRCPTCGGMVKMPCKVCGDRNDAA
jgi:hypothetical protein